MWGNFQNQQKQQALWSWAILSVRKIISKWSNYSSSSAYSGNPHHYSLVAAAVKFQDLSHDLLDNLCLLQACQTTNFAVEKNPPLLTHPFSVPYWEQSALRADWSSVSMSTPVALGITEGSQEYWWCCASTWHTESLESSPGHSDLRAMCMATHSGPPLSFSCLPPLLSQGWITSVVMPQSFPSGEGPLQIIGLNWWRPPCPKFTASILLSLSPL